MMKIPIIDPQKLKEARGERTQREIVDAVRAAGGKLSEQQLSSYELGRYRPRTQNLPYLLQALGVAYEQIITTVEYPRAA